MKFTNLCYPSNHPAVYGDPAHPRHRFPENWDSDAHPRFDFERIQASFERLIAKGYTVAMHGPRAVTVLSASGEIVFQMEIP